MKKPSPKKQAKPKQPSPMKRQTAVYHLLVLVSDVDAAKVIEAVTKEGGDILDLYEI